MLNVFLLKKNTQNLDCRKLYRSNELSCSIDKLKGGKNKGRGRTCRLTDLKGIKFLLEQKTFIKSFIIHTFVGFPPCAKHWVKSVVIKRQI